MHAATASAEVGGRKCTSSAVAQAFLSLEATFANPLWLWLVLLHALRFAIVLLHQIIVAIVLLHRITAAIVLLHRICQQYDLDQRHVRALLELQRRLPIYALSSTAGHEPQISMHTDCMLIVHGATWRLIAGRIMHSALL